ncbi:peptidase T [Fusibacter paucivorans]|uniref:Peptidase T n=1 Tax=Fusibacter paucivorans TaxID=76009 RepID=A0ABS5PKI9_9FIRM|nr:peptidase T [Fusibacter paucivorans]MBS7525684.1 peptidase T [Fusibacter paucivorans]
MKVKERFLKYVAIETTSDPTSETCPSSAKQRVLGDALVAEMQAIGISNVTMDKNGYIYGELPAKNCDGLGPKVAFLAHMDTSPDFSGKDVKARVVEAYDGSDIVLNEAEGIVMSPKKFESLEKYIGQDLIVTDGTTLLGADDKAGVAEIMTMAECLLNDPDAVHGPIKIAFTPDEEIGRGADLFDLGQLKADFGYTVDGGEIGEIEFENFNAASAIVTINGSNIHPGYAKLKMKNALLIGMAFHEMLPVFENPAYTEGYEGFSHLNDFEGNVEKAVMRYIIRDHDMAKFEIKKARFERIAAYLNAEYGEGTIVLDLKDSYYNMREKVAPHMHMIDVAAEAMHTQGVTPIVVPIRGGTDGSRLSFMGLPCPNLCTGGHNFHGKFEYIPVQSMTKTVSILIEIAKRYAAMPSEA